MPKEKTIQLRVEKELKEIVKNEAEKENITISKYILEAVNDAIDKDLD